MEYSFKTFTIQEIVDLIDKNQIDLNPSYQRNFIWSPNDQKELIDSIVLDLPLPNFFLHQRADGSYEMVDGQQRSKTIYRFVKGNIESSKKTGGLKFKDLDANKILNYKLPFIVLTKLNSNESLKDFYVLINKKGVHLNTSEVNKSEFHDTLFLKLANELLTYQNFINLNLFTRASSDRMLDRSFVEELLSYLKVGFSDKKNSVKSIFEDDITKEEYTELSSQFCQVIDIVHSFNEIFPVSKTRYKQRNDFYTLFSFVNENKKEELKTLQYQYSILVILDGEDKDGKQFIRPTNENCIALKEYANNCVSQSNSKMARDNRLIFFNAILKNKGSKPNDKLADLLTYLGSVFGDEKIELISVGGYQLLDVARIKMA